MLISTFNTLLKKKHPGARAYVDAKNKNKICIVYKKDGKVYSYNSTILDLAERLQLIPAVDIWGEAKLAVKKFKRGEQVKTYSKCYDTISELLDIPGKTISLRNNGEKDSFGRDIVTFILTDDIWAS